MERPCARSLLGLPEESLARNLVLRDLGQRGLDLLQGTALEHVDRRRRGLGELLVLRVLARGLDRFDPGVVARQRERAHDRRALLVGTLLEQRLERVLDVLLLIAPAERRDR